MQREMDMKKIICFVFVASLLLLFVSVLPDFAADPGGFQGGRGGFHGEHGGFHGSRFFGDVWLGPGWGWGWDPWWWGAPYYPYYPYYPYPYYSSPPAYQQQPQTYIQPAPQQEEQPYYWYFCRKPEGYYPYVKRCPGGWLKVIPPSGPPNEEE